MTHLQRLAEEELAGGADVRLEGLADLRSLAGAAQLARQRKRKARGVLALQVL